MAFPTVRKLTLARSDLFPSSVWIARAGKYRALITLSVLDERLGSVPSDDDARQALRDTCPVYVDEFAVVCRN